MKTKKDLSCFRKEKTFGDFVVVGIFELGLTFGKLIKDTPGCVVLYFDIFFARGRKPVLQGRTFVCVSLSCLLVVVKVIINTLLFAF